MPFEIFRHAPVHKLHTNRWSSRFSRRKGSRSSFGAKIPGPILRVGSVDMSFEYSKYFSADAYTGYEVLIYDCMMGDATLFQRADMVEAGWTVVDPVLDVWKALPPRKFPNYASGTWGPTESDHLLKPTTVNGGKSSHDPRRRNRRHQRTRLAAFETEGNRLKCVVEKIYASHDYSGLAEILPQFTRTEGIPVHSACFGVAGPVRGGRSKISNLPWTIDCKELAAQLKLPAVGLLNDLEAYAYGIDALESKDFITISAGSEDAEGNRAVISAGTGLGMAGLYWDGFRHHPFACEGGHAEFRPQRCSANRAAAVPPEEIRTEVSNERILSGPGRPEHLRFPARHQKEARARLAPRADESAADAPAADLAACPRRERPPICEQTLSIFVSVFGAEAGNCALRYMTTGGIYIGGSHRG